jgi:hypothetical protein
MSTSDGSSLESAIHQAAEGDPDALLAIGARFRNSGADPSSTDAFKTWAAESRMPEPTGRWWRVGIDLLLIYGVFVGGPVAAGLYFVGRVLGWWG